MRDQYAIVPPVEIKPEYGPPAPVAPPTSLVANLPQPGAAPAPGGDISPTALIHQYLAAKGLQPTAANVSAALLANAQRPGTISGLINQAPPDAGGGGGGGGGARAGAAPGRQGPGQDATVDMPHPEFGSKPSDATVDQPGAFPPKTDTSDLGLSILLGGGLPVAGYGAYKLAQLRGQAPPVAAVELPRPGPTAAGAEELAAAERGKFVPSRIQPRPGAQPGSADAASEVPRAAEIVRASEEGAAPALGPRRSPLYPDNPNIVVARPPPPDQMLPSEGGTPLGRRTPKPEGSKVLRKFTHGRG